MIEVKEEKDVKDLSKCNWKKEVVIFLLVLIAKLELLVLM